MAKPALMLRRSCGISQTPLEVNLGGATLGSSMAESVVKLRVCGSLKPHTKYLRGGVTLGSSMADSVVKLRGSCGISQTPRSIPWGTLVFYDCSREVERVLWD